MKKSNIISGCILFETAILVAIAAKNNKKLETSNKVEEPRKPVDDSEFLRTRNTALQEELETKRSEMKALKSNLDSEKIKCKGLETKLEAEKLKNKNLENRYEDLRLELEKFRDKAFLEQHQAMVKFLTDKSLSRRSKTKTKDAVQTVLQVAEEFSFNSKGEPQLRRITTKPALDG